MLVVAARTWRATKPVRLQPRQQLTTISDNVCTCGIWALPDTGKAGQASAGIHSVARLSATLAYTDSTGKGKQRAVEISKEDRLNHYRPSKRPPAWKHRSQSSPSASTSKTAIVPSAEVRRLEEYQAAHPLDRRKHNDLRSLLSMLPSVRALYTGRGYWELIDDILSDISQYPDSEYAAAIDNLPDAFELLRKVIVDNCRQLSRRTSHTSEVIATEHQRLLQSLYWSTPLLAANSDFDKQQKYRLLLQPMLHMAKGITQLPGNLQDTACRRLCRWHNTHVMPYARSLAESPAHDDASAKDSMWIHRSSTSIAHALRVCGQDKMPHALTLLNELAFITQKLDLSQADLLLGPSTETATATPVQSQRARVSLEDRITPLLRLAENDATPVDKQMQYALVAMQDLQDHRAAGRPFDDAAQHLLTRTSAILTEHRVSVPFKQLRTHVAHEQQGRDSTTARPMLALTRSAPSETEESPHEASMRAQWRLRKAVFTAIEWRDFRLATSLYRALRTDGTHLWEKPALSDEGYQKHFTSLFAYCVETSTNGRYPPGYEKQQFKDTSFALKLFLDWRSSGNSVPTDALRPLATVLARERNFLMLHRAWLSALDGIEHTYLPAFLVDFYTQLYNAIQARGVPETRGQRVVQCTEALLRHTRCKDSLTSSVCQAILWNLELNIRDRTIRRVELADKSISQMHAVYQHSLGLMDDSRPNASPFNIVLRAIASKREALWPNRATALQYARRLVCDMRKHGYTADKYAAGSLIFINLAASDFVSAYRVCYRAIRRKLSVHYKPFLSVILALQRAGHPARALYLLQQRAKAYGLASDPGQRRLLGALAGATIKARKAVTMRPALTKRNMEPEEIQERQQVQVQVSAPALPELAAVPVNPSSLKPEPFLETFFTSNASSVGDSTSSSTPNESTSTEIGPVHGVPTSTDSHPADYGFERHPPFLPSLLPQLDQHEYSYAFTTASPGSSFVDVKRSTTSAIAPASAKTPWQFRRLTQAITAASMAHTAAIRRWEVELGASRRAEESRSADLWRAGRADDSRWHGWTEHAAIPWY